jgi:hypothetical protein
MSRLEERLAELESAASSIEHMVDCAELCTEARAAGDALVAACAKAKEAYAARDLAKQQHCVVAGAELVELWNDVERLPKLPVGRARRILHAFQCAAGAAMDLPEIPLATVEQLVFYTERALAHQGAEPYAAWSLRGRLSFIRGDEAETRGWVDKLAPTINRYNWVVNFTTCPGCELTQIAGWLGRGAPPEDVQAALDPVLSGRGRWNDPPSYVAWLDREIGSGICEGSRSIAPRLLARSLARAGRWQEASAEAKKALARSKNRNAEEEARMITMRLDVALAGTKGTTVDRCVRELGPLLDQIEDAYELHAALVAACAAIRGTDAKEKHAGTYADMRRRALALAARLDSRLERARHAADTERHLPEAGASA